MSYYPQDSSYLSRRLVAFLAIIAVHAVVIWAFISGFANQGARYVETILQTNMIQTEKPKDLPPPPPPVDLKERPPVQVIAPDINITIPVEAPPPPITMVTTTPQAPPPPRAITPGTPVKPTFVPDVQDYYPEVSRRNGEEGRAIVKVCVNVAGKIDSVEVATATNHPLLDEAALKVAKAFRFKPATSEGKPVASCANLPVKFELHAGGG
jgi:periplasmic protein TonB